MISVKKVISLVALVVLINIGYINFCFSQSGVGTWRALGPIPFPVNVSGQVHGMGRVCQIVFHPTLASKIYAVSASGGLYISNDTGRTWQVTAGTETLPNTACSALCVDYSNDNILYLSTGDPNYYGRGLGLYKSIDAGNTWLPSNTGMGTRMCIDIIMDPTNPNVLIASTDDGIWKSNNAASSWVRTLAAGQMRSMKLKPASNTILYAATATSFYRSNDFGNTWTAITNGVTVPTDNEGMRIAVTPADPQIVYLGTTGGYGQILKSTDGGNSFSTIYSSNDQCIVCYDSTIASGSQGYYNYNLTVNPANANELLLGSHCVWRSTDGGYTWTRRTSWWNEVHTDMHELVFDPYDLNLRFNANDGGVWISRDAEATIWKPWSDGLSATEMYHGAQSPTIRNLVSAGTQDNGELYYDGIWKCNRGGDWTARCQFDFSGTVYYDNGDRRNLNPLAGDQSYNAPFHNTDEFHMDFSSLSKKTAFVGTDSLWITRDIKATAPVWRLLWPGRSATVKAIAASKADSNLLFIADNASHLYRWDNVLSASPTRVTLTTPASTNLYASLATNKYNPNIVYLSCGNTIYRSSDKGATWVNISYNLPPYNIIRVISDEFSRNERLFVCSGNVVFYKDNTTTTWTQISGLPSIAGVTDMMIYNDSSSASILRLSTYGRGSWECDIQNRMPPSGLLTSDKKYICPGNSVRFQKQTYGNLTSFLWQFPGGTPSTSTADSPLITYTTPGVYDVRLILSGPYGSDTIIQQTYINVSNGNVFLVTEGFEGDFLPGQWTQSSQSGLYWQQSGAVGGYGLSNKALLFDNFNSDAQGKHDRIITPRIDLSRATKAKVKFDVAYANYPGYKDTLMVEVSSGCGAPSFVPVYTKSTTTLATAPDTTDPFVPNNNQWRTDSISLNAFLGNSIIIAFDNVGHYGQNLYIDNVQIIVDTPVIVPPPVSHELMFTAFPNPSHGLVIFKGTGFKGSYLQLQGISAIGAVIFKKEITLQDGTFEHESDLGYLPKGVYFIKASDNYGTQQLLPIVLQ